MEPLLYPNSVSHDDDYSCCGLLFGGGGRGAQKRDLKTARVSDILDRLSQLERAQHAKQLGVWHLQTQAEHDAVECKLKGDLDGARHHTRLFLKQREKRQKLLAKKENLIHVADALRTAHSNAVMAHLVSESNVTLEGLAAACGDFDVIMDRLRDNLEVVDEGSSLLSEPLAQVDVDDEMEALCEQRDDEEAARLVLPDAPKQKNQSSSSKQASQLSL